MIFKNEIDRLIIDLKNGKVKDIYLIFLNGTNEHYQHMGLYPNTDFFQ